MLSKWKATHLGGQESPNEKKNMSCFCFSASMQTLCLTPSMNISDIIAAFGHSTYGREVPKQCILLFERFLIIFYLGVPEFRDVLPSPSVQISYAHSDSAHGVRGNAPCSSPQASHVAPKTRSPQVTSRLVRPLTLKG